MIPKPKYTIEEYLDLDRTSEARYEYFDGEIFEMSGVHPNHVRLQQRLATSFVEGTKGRDCHVLLSDLRVVVPALPPFRYPDLSALCGKPEFENVGGLPCLLNPVLIVEILSPTTEAFDRGDKFSGYKSILSFREYLLISQYRKLVTHFVKQSEKFWLQSEYREGETLSIESLECELNIDELYQGINFESETGF
jgi:Uma2 family endonuclease